MSIRKQEGRRDGQLSKSAKRAFYLCQRAARQPSPAGEGLRFMTKISAERPNAAEESAVYRPAADEG